MPTESAPLNWARVAFSAAYLGVAGITILLRRHSMFYFEPEAESYQFDRFLWCMAASFIGFSALAVQFWRRPSSPFPKYILYYPFVLAAISALVFSVTHLFEASSGFVFYYLAFAVCFILAFLVDTFWQLVSSVIEKGVP